MNLHMPQDPESEAELRYLAAVPYQLISPANNKPIIGIYQDSMLGGYLFTEENVRFSPRDAMNLLMMFDHVNIPALFQGLDNETKRDITNFDLLSQIFPPISVKYKTKAFKEEEDVKTSNNVIDILNGTYLRGQLDSKTIGNITKGIIHRVCNDFGHQAAARWIDDFQNIVTEYMKSRGFSVGVSDLIADQKTNAEIVKGITEKKTEVKNLIDQVRLGVFENNSGKTNEEEFETQINSILNQATSDAGKIGIRSLNKNNRFVVMVNAGSKGSEINISQMISCIGQQNVDNKRIPYGFDSRTLPHYTKFDDSPGARGFVESSYVQGLSPQELFGHAMAARVGLIDTAVKTSETGYIQRKMIKGLEDLMVSYDMTVRSNKGKIIQFSYGDDNIDTCRVENQSLPIVSMSQQEIFAHFVFPELADKTLKTIFVKQTLAKVRKETDEYKERILEIIQTMIQRRNDIVKYVFKNKGDTDVNCPVAFSFIINNIKGQCNITSTSIVDLSLLDALEMIHESYAKLKQIFYAPPTAVFETMYYFYLSPKDLLINKRFNKKALRLLLDTVCLDYKRAIVAPGEMVGMVAAQSLGEVSTQMTLNTFHFAGVASKSNVTRGVPRIDEILTLSEKIKNPSLSVYLKPEDETQRSKAQSIMYMLEHTCLKDILESIDICYDPDDLNSLIVEDRDTILQYREFEKLVTQCNQHNAGDPFDEKKYSKWVIRMEMDAETMLEKNITMDDVHFTLDACYGSLIYCIYSDFNADKLIFRVRMGDVLKKLKGDIGDGIDQADQITLLQTFRDQLLNNVVLRGVKGIKKVMVRKIIDNVVEHNGAFQKQDIWVLDTVGTNLLDVLGLDYIDNTRTMSNDIMEIFDVLGVEAARQSIYNELVEVVEFDGAYVNYHNYSVLVDRKTSSSKLISVARHGTNKDNTGPIAKASFEETPQMFLKAARHADLDIMRGVSANTMVGQEGHYGTNAFQVLLDIHQMQELQRNSEFVEPLAADMEVEIENTLWDAGVATSTSTCSIENIAIGNNVVTMAASRLDLGEGDANYNPGF